VARGCCLGPRGPRAKGLGAPEPCGPQRGPDGTTDPRAVGSEGPRWTTDPRAVGPEGFQWAPVFFPVEWAPPLLGCVFFLFAVLFLFARSPACVFFLSTDRHHVFFLFFFCFFCVCNGSENEGRILFFLCLSRVLTV
jgi:hypothetical protein